MCEAKSGNIWLGNSKVITRVSGGSYTSNISNPAFDISKISLFSMDVRDTKFAESIEQLVLPYHMNQIGFTFEAVDLNFPEGITYEWFLHGADAGWSEPSSANAVTYSNLSPGEYEMHAKACNRNGNCAMLDHPFTFQINAPLWARWWFILSCIFALSGVIAYFIKRRILSIRKEANRQQEKLQLEKRAAELEHKALQLQMNPHFIFNAISTIHGQIKDGTLPEARRNLVKFSRLMRQILEASRKNAISVSEELDLLNKYVEIENLARNTSHEFHLKIDDDIDLEEIAIPTMILQPFIENSIKHGFRGMKSGKINLEVAREKAFLKCRITDNGLGTNEQKSKNVTQEGESIALSLIEERLSLLNSNAYYTMEVRKNEHGESIGTRIFLYLPIMNDQ
jgi:two-component sensor histidine kinase